MLNSANRSYRWLFWFLALLGLCLDQGSKYGVFAWLYHNYPAVSAGDHQTEHQAEVYSGVFYLVAGYTNSPDPGDGWRTRLRTISSDKLPVVNHGALWGIGGKDESGSDLNHIFALVSVAAAAAIILWSFRKSTASDRWLCMALGLILAGTLGNLYDRMVFLGVRDFLQWVYLYNFPRFNVADSCLVCGAALLLLQAFFTAPAEEKQAPAAAMAQLPANAEAMPQPLTAETR